MLTTGGVGRLFQPANPRKGGRPNGPAQYRGLNVVRDHLGACELPDTLAIYQVGCHAFGAQHVLGGGSMASLREILGHSSVQRATGRRRGRHGGSPLGRWPVATPWQRSMRKPKPRTKRPRDFLSPSGNPEPVDGIEPSTYGLRNRCSTTELHRREEAHVCRCRETQSSLRLTFPLDRGPLASVARSGVAPPA